MSSPDGALVRPPASLDRRVGLRVLLVGGPRWAEELAAGIGELPGAILAHAADRAGAGRAWEREALAAADLVVVDLLPGDLPRVDLVRFGQALAQRPVLVGGALPAGLGCEDAALSLAAYEDPGDLAAAIRGWVERRTRAGPRPPVPESPELEALEARLRRDPSPANQEAYWTQLRRLGVVEDDAFEVRPAGVQGWGKSASRIQCTLERRKLATLAPELGEDRVVARGRVLPREETEDDLLPDHRVILLRSLVFDLPRLEARFEARAAWEGGDGWSIEAPCPDEVREVLGGFTRVRVDPLVDALVDLDGWVAAESRRAVVALAAALRGLL